MSDLAKALEAAQADNGSLVDYLLGERDRLCALRRAGVSHRAIAQAINAADLAGPDGEPLRVSRQTVDRVFARIDKRRRKKAGQPSAPKTPRPARPTPSRATQSSPKAAPSPAKAKPTPRASRPAPAATLADNDDPLNSILGKQQNEKKSVIQLRK